MNTQEAIEEIVQYWDKYQNDMRPETRNDFLRLFKEKRESLTHAIEHMKRDVLDVVPDGWRMTEKQQIVWDWAAAHGLTLVADECNDLLWKLLLVEEK